MRNRKLSERLWHKKRGISVFGWLSLLFVTLMAIACTVPYTPPSQAESPLIPGTDTILSKNVWQLVEATYQGSVIEFAAIQPVYISFTVRGELGRRAINCNSAGYYILAKNTHQYRLMRGVGTAIYCGDLGNQQENQLDKAILATTEYQIQGEQLFLTGDDVRIVLKRYGPLIPGPNSVLADNRWRLSEATYHGNSINFAAIQPVYVTFTADGQLVQRSTNCNTVEHTILVTDDLHYYYRLVPGTRTAEDCGEMGNQQEERLTAAISASKKFIIDMNQLFLIGDDVRIVLEIDNSP